MTEMVQTKWFNFNINISKKQNPNFLISFILSFKHMVNGLLIYSIVLFYTFIVFCTVLGATCRHRTDTNQWKPFMSRLDTKSHNKMFECDKMGWERVGIVMCVAWCIWSFSCFHSTPSRCFFVKRQHQVTFVAVVAWPTTAVLLNLGINPRWNYEIGLRWQRNHGLDSGCIMFNAFNQLKNSVNHTGHWFWLITIIHNFKKFDKFL